MHRVVLNFRDCVFSSETVTQDNMYRNYLMQSQQLFLVQKHSLNFCHGVNQSRAVVFVWLLLYVVADCDGSVAGRRSMKNSPEIRKMSHCADVTPLCLWRVELIKEILYSI